MRLAPGARGDTRGDRLCPDPVWKRAAMPQFPRALPQPLSSGWGEEARARSKPKTARADTRRPPLPPQLAAVNLHAAGLDIGAEAHDVAVPPSDDPPPVRGVGAYTADLEALADWLTPCGMTPVALESTGVSGIPLFALLETRGVEVRRVDPPQGQNIKGRPTSAVHDCQWRQRLHTVGLLAGAFRPPAQVCGLRSDLRQRAMLLTSAAQHIQPRQHALTQMPSQWPHVVSAMTGGPGFALIRAILAGERDPLQWAPLRDSRGQHDAATSARALPGSGREAPLFALAQAVERYEVYQQQITAGDQQREACVPTFADRREGEPLPPPSRPRRRGPTQLTCAVRPPVHRSTGVDWTHIAGIDETTALTVSRERGVDMSRWPSVNHFTSWLGLCPHQRVSGGQVLSQGTKPCANRAATALRLAASSLQHRQSALGAFFRRMHARLGTPNAITATAHKLARLIYRRLTHGTASVAQGMDEYEAQYRQRTVRHVRRRARELGDALRPRPTGTRASWALTQGE
jgi:transposase